MAWTWGCWLALAAAGFDPWAGGRWLIYLGGTGALVMALWHAVDHEGEALESYVTKARDKKSALNSSGKQCSSTAILRRS